MFCIERNKKTRTHNLHLTWLFHLNKIYCSSYEFFFLYILMIKDYIAKVICWRNVSRRNIRYITNKSELMEKLKGYDGIFGCLPDKVHKVQRLLVCCFICRTLYWAFLQEYSYLLSWYTNICNQCISWYMNAIHWRL